MRAKEWLQAVGVLCALLACQWLLTPRAAHADAASEARAAFERGVEASRVLHWNDARREFQRSRDLIVKPSTLFNLAVADLKLGLVDEALQALDSFERLASPTEHAGMLERAASLRAEAERSQEAARPGVERARGLIDPKGLSGKAQEQFESGRDAYARGDDQLALDALLSAHRLSGQNELLYDIGVVADRLRDDERAIRAFEGFVAALPELPEAELAQRHLQRLHKLQAQKDAPQPAATIAEKSEEVHLALSSPTPASPSLATPRAMIVVGALLMGAVVGGAFWWSDRNHDQDACDARPTECSNRPVILRQKRAAMATTLISGVASVGLLSAGAAVLAKRKRAALNGVALRLDRHELALSARFAF